MIAVRHPATVEGRTDADRVIWLVRSKLGASGIDTESLKPSNDSAPRSWPPVGDHVAPEIVPLLPRPDASLTDPPAPSLKPHEPTNPEGVGSFAVIVVDAVPVVRAVSVTVSVTV